MELIETGLPGVLLLRPRVFGDARGFFIETCRENTFRQFGIPPLVQDNHSRSGHGVLRGLHYQLEQPQGKLVRVARGAVLDVAVDIRRGSPHFGQHFAAVLSDENHCQMYVPPDFAHGFCVLSAEADFLYRCTDYYHPASERGIAWDDSALGIDWQLAPSEILLSDKDRQNPVLVEQTDLPEYPL